MAKLRQVDVLVSQGQSVAEAIRAIGVTEVTYYRWRREFGGLKSDQVKRPKDLEADNALLRPDPHARLGRRGPTPIACCRPTHPRAPRRSRRRSIGVIGGMGRAQGSSAQMAGDDGPGPRCPL